MKKNIKFSNGFTVIELLVVIAIISVLATIVLINVIRYVDRGKDAAAKGDLATLLTNAITFYNENGDFDGVASDADYANVLSSLASDKMGYTVTVKCATAGNAETTCGANSNSVKWCASIQEKADGSLYYCVGSNGAKKESTTAVCGLGVCPN